MSEKKKTMRAVIEIIIAVLVIIAVYFIIRGMDRHDVRIQQAATENETQRVWKEFQEKTVSIKLHKKTWKFAHPVQTYLFIGTDKSGNEDAEGEEYHGSMADALMLVVVDEEEKAYGILQLNRDTITEVPMLLQDGSANASAQMQLCTAHWYGKDKAASCDNTVETVSKMLGGLPIDGYYALKMDAMPLLNHEVGGVTVTLEVHSFFLSASVRVPLKLFWHPRKTFHKNHPDGKTGYSLCILLLSADNAASLVLLLVSLFSLFLINRMITFHHIISQTQTVHRCRHNASRISCAFSTRINSVHTALSICIPHDPHRR